MTKWTDKEIGVGDLLRNLGIICEHVEGVGGAFGGAAEGVGGAVGGDTEGS